MKCFDYQSKTRLFFLDVLYNYLEQEDYEKFPKGVNKFP